LNLDTDNIIAASMRQRGMNIITVNK